MTVIREKNQRDSHRDSAWILFLSGLAYMVIIISRIKLRSRAEISDPGIVTLSSCFSIYSSNASFSASV